MTADTVELDQEGQVQQKKDIVVMTEVGDSRCLKHVMPMRLLHYHLHGGCVEL